MGWKKQLDSYIDVINQRLENYLQIPNTKNQTLIEAMKYSVFAGGKRLRPVLALASYELFGNDLKQILPYACGLEMIHTYSLIHDDLPAMDDDDFRRGKPTNHKVYGEGIAILAGDGLLNYAFEIMLEDALNHKDMQPYILSIREIANAAGIHGMIGGQVVDLQSENKKVDETTLDYIHFNKTAAMITASLKIGAIIGKGTDNDIQNMEYVGKNLGLAFQIQDDILDIIGDQDKLGKNIGSDQENNKATYPALYGIECSKRKVEELTDNVKRILENYMDKSDFLYCLSNYLVDREY